MDEPVSTAFAPLTSGVALDAVSLRRGQQIVLQSINLRLTEPRIGLIGDNGAGKSSLFRVLCGLDQPTTGSLRWPAGSGAAQGRFAGVVGMMFQNPEEQIVYPTVQEELALSLVPQGFSRREALQRARQWLAARGLESWAERAISSLSQGQRQRVCWLALLIAAPQMLLLDEPFSSLDLPSQARLLREIQSAPAQLLVSSHILEPLRQFDRVIWLEGGQVHADGPAAEVCDAYAQAVAQRIAAEGQG